MNFFLENLKVKFSQKNESNFFPVQHPDDTFQENPYAPTTNGKKLWKWDLCIIIPRYFFLSVHVPRLPLLEKPLFPYHQRDKIVKVLELSSSWLQIIPTWGLEKGLVR